VIPVWVQRVPAIWIAVIQGVDPRMPAGAVSISVNEAHHVVGGGPLPLEVARAWIQGADVELPSDASPELQAIAHRLRTMLPELCRPFEPKVGADFGLPRTGAAMAACPGIPSLAQLSEAVMDTHPDGVPRLSYEARLLRALTGL